jgi:hypothetical protein
MTRLLAAAALFIAASVPAVACTWDQSASTDPQSSTVASQPTNDQSSPPPSAPADHPPS